MSIQANLASALAPCVPLPPLYEDLPTNACLKTRSIGQSRAPSFARPLRRTPRTAKESSKPLIAATNQVAVEWTPIGWEGGRPDSDGEAEHEYLGANSSGLQAVMLLGSHAASVFP